MRADIRTGCHAGAQPPHDALPGSWGGAGAAPTLLQRDHELAAIGEELAGLSAGRQCLVMVSGDRGSGKSALLRTAAAGLPGVVLRARCHWTEQGQRYGVLSQLLDDLPPGQRQPATSGLVGPGSDRPEHEVLDQFYRAIRAVATTGPVVVVIDDLHLADPASVRWCSYVARRCDDLPVGLLATAGSDEPPAGGCPATAQLIADLVGLAQTRLLRLGPLCLDCTEKLLTRAGLDPVTPELVRRCHHLTGGNPQLLSTLGERLAATGGGLAVTTEDAVTAAARVLGDTAISWFRQDDPVKADLVEQFAVGGAETLDTAATLIGQGAHLAQVVRMALRRIGLLSEGEPDRFVHPAIRAAILDRLTPSAQAKLHIQAASTLSRMGEPATLAAEHVMSVGPIGEPWVLPLLRRAARQAAVARDWSRAARYLNRALLEPSGPGHALSITAELGAVQVHNDLAACRHRLTTAADLAAADPEQWGTLAGFADAALTVEDAEATAVFRRAGEAVADADGSDRTALLRLAAQTLLSGAGLTGPVRKAVRRLSTGPQDVAAGQLQSALALTMAAQGRNRQRCRALAVQAAGGGPVRTAESVASTTACAAMALAWAGELDAAADAATQAVEVARWMSSRTGEALSLLVRSDVAYRFGNLDSAVGDARAAVTLAKAAGAANLSAAALANLTRISLVRGEADGGLPDAGESGQEADGHPFLLAIRREAEGMVAAAAGNHAQALRRYLECGRYLVAAGLVNPACSAWRSRAVATMLHLGRVWEARTLATHELALARRWGAPGPLGRALVAAAATHEGEDRLELLAEAVRELERTECRLDLARALVRQGAALHQAGQGSAARAELERGLELAHACRAGPLGDIARRALHAAGGRPREQSGATELTSAERRVAELVIRGMSNQAVARTLTLSKRTIDTHLGRIYRKLGISGRAQLGEVLTKPDG